MPIARIPNKVLTLMQTEDKKTGKIVSLQKNLEGSTKEVVGEKSRGAGKGRERYGATAVSGNMLLRRLRVFVICGRGSVRSWGKCLQRWGVGRGVFHSAQTCLPRKGTFSLSRKSRCLYRKGTENNGWGSK